MSRLTIILCFIPRVISGIYTTVQHETYSEHISRQSRSNLPTQQDGYMYRQFDKPGVRSPTGQSPVDPYAVNNHFESKSFRNIRSDTPVEYKDLIEPYTTPSTLRSEVDYALAKSAADARYESSKSTSDSLLDKLKSLMHYHPPPDMSNENYMSGYDGTNDYHMDDDDIRSSSRSLYDSWPYFYHSPYEYEHNKVKFDTQKAKDKRYVADGLESIIPVHEIIENDHPPAYDGTPKYLRDVRHTTDNPIGADGPFFSFILNDYFERSDEEDPIMFKGLDFSKEFDQETYIPESDESKTGRRLRNNNYYSTISPATVNYDANTKLAESEKNRRREHAFDKGEIGEKKNSQHKTGFENHANQYNGFKDFLDNFSNKFGSEDIKKNLNYIRATNQDKGENKKGFRRVYHKDEYQEDKEFFDNNNSSAKGIEKAGYNGHVGGSEAYLRSQAAAAVGNQMNAISNAGNTNDAKFENSHKGHDRLNTLENSLHKYRNVAKAAAQSNDADYTDNYRDHYYK